MREKLENLEKIIFNWVVFNRHRIVFLALVSLLIVLLSFLPYVNLLILKELIPVIIFIAAIFILDLDETKIIKLGILILVVALFLFLIDRLETAEILGNYLYLIFLTAVLKNILKLYK